MPAIDGSRLEELRARFSGEVLEPGDAGYEESRRIHNGLIDKQPGLIARCQGTADIVDAVNFARDGGYEVSVRGGGHNVAGKAVTDGGVMIDLARMKEIHVDPAARTVRAQAGVTWGEFNQATAIYGLAVTGGVISTTGIAGLTLGGGLGWLMGMYGMAVDNLRSVELVTASGEVLTASAEENVDLFWGLRGGGGNFGVASSFEYDLHPLRMVTGGLVAHPFAAAQEVLQFYRDVTASLPDDLTVFSGLVHALDGSGTKLAALFACHAGPPEEAQARLQSIREFGAPAMIEIGLMPYPLLNTLLDDGFPRGAMNYWKSSFLSELSDKAIDILIERFAEVPSPMSSLNLEHFHGAATRVGVTDTAFPHRDPGHNLVIISEWMDPAQTKENVAWARETYAAMDPFLAKRRYVNYLGEDEGGEAVKDAFGPNYDRLAALKTRYDPTNLFRLNQNIPPSAG